MTLDLGLLASFVAVVDAGGFTRAAERLHRTQSTISQQIKRLEDQMERRLLDRERSSGAVRTTEEGERLLGYARRMLSLADEAQESMRWPAAPRPVRLGITEDFAGKRLAGLLSGFTRASPQVRLHTVSAWSVELLQLMEAGDIDLAIVKREPGAGPCLARRPERLVWVGDPALIQRDEPVPLALFPQGCIYRTRATSALEAKRRDWRVAYTSQGLAGVQAAVASGLGVSLLSEDSVLPEHGRLSGREGFEDEALSEVALVARPGRRDAAFGALAEYLERVVFQP